MLHGIFAAVDCLLMVARQMSTDGSHNHESETMERIIDPKRRPGSPTAKILGTPGRPPLSGWFGCPEAGRC